MSQSCVRSNTTESKRKETKFAIQYFALTNKLAKTNGLEIFNLQCDRPTDLFLALSSVKSVPQCTSWSSWAQSGSWSCQTLPPPIPPCSARLQTDSQSRRKASRGCCLCEPQKERDELLVKTVSIKSCKLIDRLSLFSFHTWAVIRSCQPNRCYTCN